MNEPEVNQNMEQKCPKCGAPLPSGVLAGLCPACLLKQGAAVDTGVAPEAAPFQPPSVEEVVRLFPQLEILGLIGKGGMGAVYKARQPGLDRLVALKILPPQTAAGPGFVERFNREARALARLNHPNIVGVHEFGQVNGLYFFIMEYVDGLNLREVERAGKLSPHEALQIVPQICEALQFAHDEGIVHRDIKPENILLDKKGRVKIADFGIAKILGGGSEPELTQTQSVVGTPHYMAPEQMEKPTSVDHRADIFSLGVVFYEMLTGELPLGKFAPPSARKVEVDVRLDDVVLRTLERDPELRYQHVSQVKSAVDTIVGTAAPPPRAPGVDADALARAILAKDYQLSIRSCVRRGWKLVTGEFWPFVGITALFMALFGLAGSIGGSTVLHESDGGSSVEVMSAVAMLVFGPLWGGLLVYYLKKIRREPATVEIAFSGFSPRFLHLFLVGFAATLLIGIGFFCLVLPGIYLSVAWIFALPIVADKGIDFWSAMELSRKVVNRHWFKLFGFLLMLWLLTFAGVLALLVGALVMFPVALGALMYAYEDILGSATGTAPAPAATGPSGTIVMPPLSTQPVRGGMWTPTVKIGLGVAAVVLLVVIVVPVLRHHLQLNPTAAFRSMTVSQTTRVDPAPEPTPSPEPPTETALAAGTSAAPAFGPVLELVLTNLGAVNLVSGAQKSLPAYLAGQVPANGKDMAVVGWMEGADMDFGYVDGCGYSMLSGWAHLARDSWEGNPDTVTAALQKTGQDVGTKFDGTGADNPTNYTIGFQTRSGRVGLLQFVSFPGHELNSVPPPSGATSVTPTVPNVQDSPPGVRIRYKFIEPVAGSAAAVPGLTLASLAERMEAAENMSFGDERDQLLAAIAVDAGKLGEVEMARSALSKMNNSEQRDAAAHDTAMLLAKRGLRRPAIEMAKGIPDTNLRDQTLSELAK